MVGAFGLGGGRMFMFIYMHELLLLKIWKNSRNERKKELNVKRLVSNPRMIKKNIAF